MNILNRKMKCIHYGIIFNIFCKPNGHECIHNGKTGQLYKTYNNGPKSRRLGDNQIRARNIFSLKYKTSGKFKKK